MKAKERRTLRHSLKTNMDEAEIMMKLVALGSKYGMDDPVTQADTVNSRAFLTRRLTELKSAISDDFSKFITQIDVALSKLN